MKRSCMEPSVQGTTLGPADVERILPSQTDPSSLLAALFQQSGTRVPRRDRAWAHARDALVASFHIRRPRGTRASRRRRRGLRVIYSCTVRIQLYAMRGTAQLMFYTVGRTVVYCKVSRLTN